MNFIFKTQKALTDKQFDIKNGINEQVVANTIHFKAAINKHYFTDNYLFLGDNDLGKNLNYRQIIEEPKRILKIKGLFYLIIIWESKIYFFTSLFNILPIYVYDDEKTVIISSSISLIRNGVKNLTISKKYILEQNLFNYSFSDSTIYNEIKLVPPGCTLTVTDKISIRPYFSIENHFTDDPISPEKSIDNLTNIFIEVNKNNINNGDYISFTSGFDGRSLVALGKYLKKDFATYSFGTEENEDIYLPKFQAKELGINYYPINLDTEEYFDEFWNLGTDIINKTGAATNFLQVHWAYSAKLLSIETDTLISGVFGSEVFRSAHIAGQFTSPALVNYFKNIETDEWINKIRTAESLIFLNKENFKVELEELIEEMNDYKRKIIQLNPSQRFYKCIFDEVFRKFFGVQFLQPQLDYVNVNTPYLDFEFIKELLKTELAGVNNKFFTNNPLKRFKGQLFYAKLIEKTYPELSKLTTGKGYKPVDLLSFIGKVNITYNFFKKRIKRNIGKINLDNLGIISAYKHNKTKFENIPIIDEYYNLKYIEQYHLASSWHFNEINRNKFLEALSTNYYLNEIKK